MSVVLQDRIDHAILKIPLYETSKELATINTICGLIQFNFLPLGLTVSPEIFLEQLDRCISSLEALEFQDDIVVFAFDKQQHDELLL